MPVYSFVFFTRNSRDLFYFKRKYFDLLHFLDSASKKREEKWESVQVTALYSMTKIEMISTFSA